MSIMAHCDSRFLFFNFVCLLLLFTNLPSSLARKHTLELKEDERTYFVLSSFGFFEDGLLEVHLRKFQFSSNDSNSVFGFSLDKTSSNAISPYLENHQDECVLQEGKRDSDMTSVTFFVMDLVNKKLRVTCRDGMKSLHISEKLNSSEDGETQRKQRAAEKPKREKINHGYLFHTRRKRDTQNEVTTDIKNDKNKADATAAKSTTLPAETESKTTEAIDNEKETGALPSTDLDSDSKTETQQVLTNSPDFPNYLGETCEKEIQLPLIEHAEPGKKSWFETSFVVRILNPEEEGLYSLYFHNCPNYHRMQGGKITKVNVTIDILEMNGKNYLSAGQILLPTVYFCLSMLFFLSGCFWIYVLRKSKPSDVYKIHYLMALLVYVKSFSLLFHGINFHFIETSGMKIEGWAVLYYVTHLLKGALLFITIVMIGTGWALIKHIISDKEKKIFMIVIPLQVLANVAEIIIEESEEGATAHSAWREVFILVDLLCCGAILFPVVWSIRHLQEASQTDGKAAINLKKLKLFRHFYIMIVCYIYFTRIIVYLLRITVPFKYEWLDETFRGVATLIFFVMTGYKFRPASNNPYLQLPTEDDELEMEEVLTQGGALEGLSKMSIRNKIGDKDNSISKQESSHEYD